MFETEVVEAVRHLFSVFLEAFVVHEQQYGCAPEVCGVHTVLNCLCLYIVK